MADFIVNIASQGSEKVQADLNKILSSANATSGSIAALSRTLNTSANSAAAFANKLGLSASQSNSAIARYRELKAAGANNVNIYKALNGEIGLSATQYKNLVVSIKDVDRQTDAYTQSLKDQQAAQDRANKESMEAQENSAAQILALQQVQQYAQQAASALGGVVGRAISEYTEYEDALTSVAAKSGATGEELATLEASVREVALATSQSPAGALRAADSLIALGASADEASSNVKAVAQLTDALRTSGADIETSAKVIQLSTSLYSEFGLSAEQVGNKIAVLSDTTAAASTGGIAEFLQLLGTAGGVASSAGVSFDELLAVFGLLRDAGQQAEVASTALKNITLNLKIKKGELEALGFELFNIGANGEESLKPLAEIFGQIESKTIDTTEVTKIFGMEAAPAIDVLIKSYGKLAEGTSRLNGTTDELQQKSDAINSSLAGQAQLLGGSIQTAFVELGKVVGQFTGPTINFFNTLVNKFIEAPQAVKTFVGAILGLSSALATGTLTLVGYALGIKALQAAQVGTTIKTLLLAAANVKNTIATTAANIASIGLAKTMQILGVAAVTAAQGVTAAVGSILAVLGPVLAVITALKTSQEIVTRTWKKIDDGAAKTRGSVANVEDAINSYRKSVGMAEKETTKSVGGIGEVFQAVKSGIDFAFKLIVGGVGLATEAIEFFVEGYAKAMSTVVGATADFLDVLPWIPDSLIAGLRRVEQEYANFDFATVAEAQSSRANVAFGDLIDQVGALEQEYINLQQKGVKPGSDAAIALAKSLKIASDELKSQTDLNAEDAATRDRTIGTLDRYVNALGATVDAQGEVVSSVEEVASAVSEIGSAYDKAIADFEGGLAEEIIRANNDVKLSAEEREAKIAAIEAEGAQNRLGILEDFLAERKALSDLTEEDEKENADAIIAIESEIADIRLKIAEEEASRRDEIEKARIEKQKALRQAALDKDLENIETLKQAEELRVQATVNARKELLEALDDETEAIQNQLKLLDIESSTQQAITDARIQQLGDEVSQLESAKGLIEQIKEGELNRTQILTAQQELSRLGLSARSSEADVIDMITKKREEQRQVELQALQERQAQEQKVLELQQAQERIELRRQEIQANIAAIEAQSLVTQGLLTLESDKRLLAFKKQELAAAQREGASESELISLRGQIDAQESKIALSEAQLPLLQQGADLAAQQVQDARDAQAESEQIFQAQQEQLQTTQGIQTEQQIRQDQQERVQDNLQRGEVGLTGLRATTVPRATLQPVSQGGLGIAASQRVVPAGVAPASAGLQTLAPQLTQLTQLVAQIANRPVPVVNANTTFVNEPSPISAMVAVQQGQLQAARGL